MIRIIKLGSEIKHMHQKRNSGEKHSTSVSHKEIPKNKIIKRRKEIPLAILSRKRDDGTIC